MQPSRPRTSNPRATRNKRVDSTELLQVMVPRDEPRFDPFTGADFKASEVRERSYGTEAGLETSRFCQLCGRRMVVQVRPDDWTAECSYHDKVDSVMLEQR